MADEYGATVREWVDLVRRARLGRTTKAVAFAVAQYADGNGRRVFPGIARLSVECELSYNSVKAALAALRTADLLQLVHKGSSRGRADEYRLAIGPTVLDRIDVLSPNDVTSMIEKLSAAHRRQYEPKPSGPQPTGRAVVDSESGDVQPTPQAVVPVDKYVGRARVQPSARAVVDGSGESCTAHGAVCESGTTAHGACELQPTPWAATHHGPDTTSTHHKKLDVDVEVTVVRARADDPNQISHSEVKPDKGRHAAAGESEPEPTNVIPIRRTA